MSNLPKYGIQAVIEGLPDFLKGMDSINKKIGDSSKATGDAAKKVSPFDAALDKVGNTVGNLQDKLKGFVQDSIPFGNQLGGITDLLLAIPLPALAAVAAITALVGGFLALGNRGAPLIGLGRAFDNLTASVGLTSTTLLVDLRKAAAGTISDFKLIETANVALTGATGQLGVEIGKNLPALLNLARQQAKVTGKDVDFLFTSIIEGIRKSSPLRLDNAGLIISETAANDAYAKSLGKSAAQLTQSEKGIAILNATLEAGNAALEQAGNLQETNAEKLSRVNATITNIFDSLAVAVQPAFGVVLDAVQKVLDLFQQLALAVAPIFGGFVSVIANYFGEIVDIVTTIIQPIFDVISSIAPYFALAFQTVANIISLFGKIVGAIVGKIVTFLKDVSKNFFGLDLENLGPQLFNGAAAAFGSFANGIIKVANDLIFPAVLWIAKTIADFLIGNSPPPEGPLSVIDKGGANLMSAWMDGIAGVSLDPVKQVAKEVSDALGSIGKQNLTQVTARLGQLDKALLPFQNRLDIIKSQFDALNEPAKNALDAIDRQAAQLQDAVAGGDSAAAERLRLLDQQRDAIQGQVDAQQALVDRAQIQLGLAQAQQAPERALLNIRKTYLEALAKAQPKASTTSGGGAPKEPKEKKGKGGAEPASAGGAAPVSSDADLPSVLDLIGGQDKVDAAAKGIQDAFTGAIDQSGLDQFGENSKALDAQIARIGSVDIGAKIGDKFKGLTDAFDPNVEGSIANKISVFFNGDSSTDGSIAFFFAHAGDSIDVGAISAKLQTALASIFDPSVDGSAASIVVGLITDLTGDDKNPGKIAGFFAGLPDRITTAVSTLVSTLQTSVLDPISKLLTGTDPGSLGDIINQAVGFFSGLPVRIVDSLRGIGVSIYTALALPVIKAINGLIGGVEQGLQTLVDQIAGFVDSITNALGDATPEFLRNAAAGLHGTKVSFGRISEELPAFLQAPNPPAGAKGGLFGEGLFKVGEKGPEYLFSGEKFGVLPNQLTQILTSLSSVLAQPSPMAVPSGNTSNTTNNSSFTFNGVAGDNDARRRYNTLRAGMS